MNCLALHNFQSVEKQQIYARSQQKNAECQELHCKGHSTRCTQSQNGTSKKANEF